MNIFLLPSLWLGAGILLMLAELVIPGGVVVFLGLASLVVAAAIGLGLINSAVSALTLFFICSLALIISLRAFFMRYAGGDSSRGNIVEILDHLGQQAEVVENIGPGEQKGTILYNGTRWKALGDGSLIPAGSTVQIVGLDNVNYIVEPLTAPNSTSQGE